MGGDLKAKLCKLKENLDKLTEDDGAFVNEMVSRDERGQLPKPLQIARIMDMRIPGEEIPPDPIWREGIVEVIYVSREDVIWRYISLEQLFSLLWKKSLHFSPLAVMEDTSEGHLPERAFNETEKQLAQSMDGVDAGSITATMMKQRKTDACVTCWYLDRLDSLRMWQKYAPNNGIAIQTTVGRLASSLRECSTPVHIGQVKYFRPEEEEQYIDEMFYGSLFVKRDPFQHEKELRALAFNVNIGHGVDLLVDPGILIERLVLSPELKDWAVPVITEVIGRFNFTGPVEQIHIEDTDIMARIVMQRQMRTKLLHIALVISMFIGLTPIAFAQKEFPMSTEKGNLTVVFNGFGRDRCPFTSVHTQRHPIQVS